MKKEIKTLFLYARQLDLAANKALDYNAVLAKMILDDISIVGVQGIAWFDAYIPAAENFEEGRFQVYAELSMTGTVFLDGSMVVVPVQANLGVEVAYAANWGKFMEHTMMMLPEDKTIDIDDKQYLYINFSVSVKGFISDDPVGEAAAMFIIYYFER